MKIIRQDEFGRPVEIELTRNESFVKRWHQQLVKNGMTEYRASRVIAGSSNQYHQAAEALQDTAFYMWLMYGIGMVDQ